MNDTYRYLSGPTHLASGLLVVRYFYHTFCTTRILTGSSSGFGQKFTKSLKTKKSKNKTGVWTADRPADHPVRAAGTRKI